MKPIFIDFRTQSIEKIKKQFEVQEVVDVYRELLEELFLVRNPKYKFDKNYQEPLAAFIQDHIGTTTMEQAGEWFYFPWNKTLTHYLPDELHQEIRTARNKNLITKDEQSAFYNFTVGIVGLSVGSHAALTLSMMGGSRRMKLADPDTISGSNLNRIRYDFTKAGKSKSGIATEQIYQMNPYSEVHEFQNGITQENINEFLSSPKIDLLIEECDNLEMKIRLRIEARKLGIPVIMATDNGDNVVVDIERYDLDKNLEIFNGVAGNLTLEEFQSFPPQELPKLATKIAGPNFVMPRMLSSLAEVGKTLYSWPQLGDAATLCGATLAYLTKRFALGEKIKSGKLEVNLDAVFDPEYSPEQQTRQREQFLAHMGLL